MIAVHFANPVIVFDYYDGIEVLTFKQYNSKNYISIWYDHTEEYESHRYIEITNEELQKLKLKEMDIKTLFSIRKSFEVANPIRIGEHCNIIDGYKIYFVKLSEFPIKNLPKSGIYLDFLRK
jgi:hypothetical protein